MKRPERIRWKGNYADALDKYIDHLEKQTQKLAIENLSLIEQLDKLKK